MNGKAMKKTVLISLSVLAIACTREPVFTEKKSESVFGARFAEAPASKTVIDEKKVLWTTEDRISILWDGGSAVAQSETPGLETRFVATVGDAADYYGVYPSSVTATLSGSNILLTVPSAQHGGFAEANIALAKSNAGVFAFKNLCAIGKLVLQRSDIAEIRISGNGGEALCGDVSVSLDSEGIPSCSGAAGTEIVLTPSSGSAFGLGPQYFSVIPGTVGSGLTITLKTSAGVTLPVKSSTKSAFFVRSRILGLGSFAPDAPDPVLTKYSFDFTQSLSGWPTTKNDSWASLKNFDSGCATDNGGTADSGNPHRRAQVTYTIGSVDFDFTFADPDNASAHNIYLSSTGVYVGTWRYFGLPAIPGKKLVKIEMTNSASNKNPASFTRNVGVTSQIYDVNDEVASFSYVPGGEPQNQAATGPGTTVFTYNLSGTAANTVYYLCITANASVIKTMDLYYADAEDPTPTLEYINLTFPFTGEPLAGWPTEKHDHIDGGTQCIYPLNGTNYVFVPADCGGASACQSFWSPSGYFALNSQYRYLGLPVIDGYALTKVVCHNVKLSATVPQVGITSQIWPSTAHPDSDAYVSGGARQSWAANGGGSYAYNLTGTKAGTRYYIYAYAKGAISSLELTYTPVD